VYSVVLMIAVFQRSDNVLAGPLQYLIETIKATTRGFHFVLILAVPVDKGHSPFRKRLILQQQVYSSRVWVPRASLPSLQRAQQIQPGSQVAWHCWQRTFFKTKLH